MDSIISRDPSRSQQALQRTAKSFLQSEEDDERHEQLFQLPAQGLMSRAWDNKSPELWVKALQGLPLSLTSLLSVPLLTHCQQMLIFKLGGRRAVMFVSSGSHRQTLPHVLNNCPAAMDLHQYSWRHDEVLTVLEGFIRDHLPPSFTILHLVQYCNNLKYLFIA